MREKIRDLIRDIYDKINYYNKEITNSDNVVHTSNLISSKNELLTVVHQLEEIIKKK